MKLPDLSIDGYHKPRSGDACAGIAMISSHVKADTTDYWSEYLETKLSSPLEAGHIYYICYYVCLTSHASDVYNIISVGNIGARLTIQMLDTISPGPMYFVTGSPDISTSPGLFITDTVNWTLVSGIYHAAGGEQWLTIGRFYTSTIDFRFISAPKPDINVTNSLTDFASICYMLVDDVCAIDMDNPEATDTILYTPQFPVSIGLGKAIGQFQYLWTTGDTSEQIEVSGPGSYVRQRWGDCGYYIDTFTITKVSVDYCISLPNAFTPNNDGLNDLFGPGDIYCHPDFSDYSFNIYNRWGQLVFQTVEPGIKWDGKYNGVPQEIGVYYYTLQYSFANAPVGTSNSTFTYSQTPVLIRGDVTLIR